MSISLIVEKISRTQNILKYLPQDVERALQQNMEILKSIHSRLNDLQIEENKITAAFTEQEAKLSAIKEEKTRIEQKILDTNVKIKELAEKYKQSVAKNESIQRERKELEQSMDKVNNELLLVKSEQQKLNTSLEQLKQHNTTLQAQLGTGLKAKEAENEVLALEVQQLKSSNGVSFFIMEDFAETVYEIDVLAILLKEGKKEKSALKNTLEGKLSPVLVTRTLSRLVDKHIIRYDESKDEYSVL